MIIRDANINDAESIVYINVMGWKHTYKDIFPKEYLDKLDPSNDESIEKCKNSINQYAVCELEGEIVGMVRYGKNKKKYDDEYGEIYALYVKSGMHKKGVGTQLIRYAFEKLKNYFDFCVISTLEANSANAFYSKTGGKRIGKSTFILDNKTYTENVYKYILNE